MTCRIVRERARAVLRVIHHQNPPLKEPSSQSERFSAYPQQVVDSEGISRERVDFYWLSSSRGNIEEFSKREVSRLRQCLRLCIVKEVWIREFCERYGIGVEAGRGLDLGCEGEVLRIRSGIWVSRPSHPALHSGIVTSQDSVLQTRPHSLEATTTTFFHHHPHPYKVTPIPRAPIYL